MKNLLFSAFLLMLVGIEPLSAQFSLRVGDPRFSWQTTQGTIEEATLSVRPMGVYWEYGLYLTFSAKGTSYTNFDSLEVVLKFELPENAIVHDSWLWIGDDIARADILDRWTAGNIYEGIVNRRQDPSILYKNDAKRYELRVFPMPGKQTRRVKISYLMPPNWDVKKVWSTIPIQILNTSKYTLPKLNLLVWPDSDWENPEILNQIYGMPSVFFSEETDPEQGLFYKAEIPNANFSPEPLLRFDSPMQNGYFLRTLEDSDESFYQLAIMPQTLQETRRKKIALLFDRESNSGTVSHLTVIEQAKQQLLGNLLPTDSFNLIYSGLQISQASENWLPANPNAIDAAFAELGNALSAYSNLPALLSQGIDFVKEKGNDGLLMLFSSSSQFYTNESATDLHNDLVALMGAQRPILHIVDYRSLFTPSQTIGGIWYVGNEYLYFRLAQSTAGSFQTVRNSTLDKAVSSAFANTYAKIENFDFYTTVEDGFCYGRYFVQAPTVSAYVNKPIVQVGKYFGELPFIVEMAGETAGSVFFNDVVIPNNEAGLADSLTREMWYGKYIQQQESGTQSNNIIVNVISNSLQERVLSRYTAFLCLEDTAQICGSCLDETQFTDTNIPDPALDSLATAYPNPFSDFVEITVNAKASKKSSERVSIEIYNIRGQLVRLFEAGASPSSGPLKIRWDGTDTQGSGVASGMYILMVRVGDSSQVLKLIKQ